MATDPVMLVALASAGTAAIALASGSALKGWRAWLEVRRLQTSRGRRRGPLPVGGRRSELGELRERVRRLEAIADGSGD